MTAAHACSSTAEYVLFTAIDGAERAGEGSRMAEGRMTAAEFEALQPRLRRLTIDSYNVARAVFVDGMRPVEVATQHGTSRQRVNGIIRRVEEAMKEFPADWRRVDVFLPPELAAQVERMAEEARAAYAAGGANSSSGSPA
ncbi:TrfB-related DNA-binding protein [Roseomonas gilardii]|nr:TrfB-related DNA-binding protein [Roseomonas gilardii]